MNGKIGSVLGLVLATALAGAANAATYVVNSTDDAVDVNSNDGVCLTAGGACTLRAAVQQANSNVNADIIEVPGGVYTLSIAGVEDLAATGDLDVRAALTIEGETGAEVIVDAAGIDRVFDVVASLGTPLVVLDSLIIRNGAVADDEGAGVRHLDDGSLELRDVVLTDNHVSGTTSAAIGGALAVLAGGNVTIRNSVLTANSADRGGAIFNNSTLTIEDTTITGNAARVGAALELFGDTTVQRSAIFANEASDGDIIGVASDATLIVDSTVSDNIATGAAFTSLGGTLTIERSTIFANATAGGIRVGASGTVSLFASVVADSASSPECIDDGGLYTSHGFNFDDDGSCAVQMSDITGVDARLGPLADNGGPTFTRAPLFGSPLIDGGDEAPSCSGVDQRGLPRPVDAGGDAIARCDIGAVELAPEPVAGALALTSLLALAGLRRGRGSPQ